MLNTRQVHMTRSLLSACCFPTPVQLTGPLSYTLQMRPSVQELLNLPYVSQYIQKYAEHIMQVPDDTGRAPSLNLDQLPIVKQIRRYMQCCLSTTQYRLCLQKTTGQNVTESCPSIAC